MQKEEVTDRQEQLRKIAILVSSIESKAAQDLLDQFPKELAAAVRKLENELGAIEPGERHEVLTDFKDLLAKRSVKEVQSEQSVGSSADDTLTQVNSQLPQFPIREITEKQDPTSPTASKHGKSQWSNIPADVIVQLMRNQRPVLVAALIAELDAYTASEVLSSLPDATSCKVLRALKRLHEVDSQSKAEMEGILGRFLEEARLRKESGQQYQRQLSALVEAAPEELQQAWRTAIAEDSQACIAHEEQGELKQEFQPTQNFFHQNKLDRHAGDLPPNNGVDSSWGTEGKMESTLDDLLRLNPEELADVFGAVDAETTLLALAGASSSFMNEFLRMLEPTDAESLKKRLQHLGPLKLTDIDIAQATLLTQASSL